MLILGIETSCDETSAALVVDGRAILSNAVFSQTEIHSRFNGVVPEIASRNHLVKLLDILDESLKGHSLKDAEAVAVTNGPGLIGSLLIGLSAAKAIAYARGVPLVPVNHIQAHMYAPHLFHDIEFPYIGLVASGGHTILYLVRSFHEMNVLGTTIDDAVGEAFDKVAKLLGLGYPGGPLIDRAAKNGDPNSVDLPLGLTKPADRYNFSYSGLKTAVAYKLRGMENTPSAAADIAASFQKSAIDHLVRKAKNALADHGTKRLAVSGGVAANSCLRARLEELKSGGIDVYTAPPEYCGDNAAMVAGRAFEDLKAGATGGFQTEVFSRLPYIVKGKREVRK